MKIFRFDFLFDACFPGIVLVRPIPPCPPWPRCDAFFLGGTKEGVRQSTVEIARYFRNEDDLPAHVSYLNAAPYL
jgi:hypothetical protein